jgi:hypothetical protein
MKSYVLRNIRTDEYVTMSLDEILEEINRDRSEEWQDYDETDWQEGLDVFTEFVLIKEVE